MNKGAAALALAGLGILLFSGKGDEEAPPAPPRPQPPPNPRQPQPTKPVNMNSDVRQFLASLGEASTPQREQAILGALGSKMLKPIEWYSIPVASDTHTGAVYVSADAISLGDANDSVRVNFTPKGLQTFADSIGALIPTSKVVDAVRTEALRQGNRIEPVTASTFGQSDLSHMADTSWMIMHSDGVTRRAQGRVGVLSNVGKLWIVSLRAPGNFPGWATNYGWYSDTNSLAVGQSRGDGLAPRPLANGGFGTPRYGMIQSEGRPDQRPFHNDNHIDYSQVGLVMLDKMNLDGSTASVADVLRDPSTAGLISYDGPLTAQRYPTLGGVNV